MLQYYSGHGSQYWASSGFLGLALPPAHPVWTETEEPMAVERGDYCVAMAEPGFLVRGTRADGIVRVASHRSDHYPLPLPRRLKLEHAGARLIQALKGGAPPPGAGPDDAHYRKLAYSTHVAPELGKRGDERDIDSQITLLLESGRASRRVKLHPIAVVDRFAAAAFYPHEPDWSERVETVSIPRGSAEIRVHHVTTRGAARVRDEGFAVAGDAPPEAATGPRWARAARRDGLTSLIAGLHGFGTSGVQPSGDTNPFGPHSATPYLTSSPMAATEGIFVSLVVLSGRALAAEEAIADIAGIEVSGRQVSIACSAPSAWTAPFASRASRPTGRPSPTAIDGSPFRGTTTCRRARALTDPEGDQIGLVAFSENMSGSNGNRGPGRKPPPSTGSVKAMTFHRQ